MNKLLIGWLALLVIGSCASNAQQGNIDLTKIEHLAGKGRVQDREYNKSVIVDQLLAQRTEAIPFLIAKLDDETRLAAPVMNHWYQVYVGDVALVILTDFFTDNTWQKPTIPGVDWNTFLQRGNDVDLTAEQVLRNYIAQHGRAEIKRRWEQIWQQHKDQIIWDDKQHCFTVRKH